jgi:hypothetical protein
MVAYTSSICDRQTRWHFTHGEIIGDMHTFTVTNFRDPKKPVRYRPSEVPLSGHGGGDVRLVSAFVEAVREGKQEILGTDISDVLRSHITVFAAEASRREGRVIDYAEFEKKARESANQYV